MNKPPYNNSHKDNYSRPNPFSKELEKQIDEVVDQILADSLSSPNSLITPALQKASLKKRMSHELEYPELTSHLTSAFDLLTYDQSCLEPSANLSLHEALASAADTIFNLSSDELLQNNENDYMKLLGFTSAHIQFLNTIGAFKYDQQLYKEAIGVYVLLTMLIPNKEDNWLRLGIAAQENDDLDLALRAYQTAISLNSQSIAPHLFCAECYLMNKQLELAKSALAEAEKLSSKATPEMLELQNCLILEVSKE